MKKMLSVFIFFTSCLTLFALLGEGPPPVITRENPDFKIEITESDHSDDLRIKFIFPETTEYYGQLIDIDFLLLEGRTQLLKIPVHLIRFERNGKTFVREADSIFIKKELIEKSHLYISGAHEYESPACDIVLKTYYTPKEKLQLIKDKSGK